MLISNNFGPILRRLGDMAISRLLKIETFLDSFSINAFDRSELLKFSDEFFYGKNGR